MSKKAALACVLLSVIPIESSLADTELKTFRPGDTIRSSEINRNFSNLDEKDEALEDKIDGNYNTLDNRVSTLESSNNSSGGSGGSSAASTLTGYVIQNVLPIADMDASEVQAAFSMVAGPADELEKLLVGGDRL